jgi:hypothetical protein
VQAQELASPTTAEEPVPLERLEAEITELAGHLAAAEHRWLLLIAEYDRRAGYEQWGCRSCAHWLSWHCSLDLHAARDRVRVARALEALPLISAEFGAGKLSYSKVRALTRVATPANASDLVTIALHATAVQVERAVRAYRGAMSAEDETAHANARHMVRYLRYDWAEDGSLEGSFPRPAGRARGFATTNCDALTMMAETFLAHATGQGGRGDRFQIVINADAAVLADDADGRCELDGGPALAPETARRLACDASVVHRFNDAAGQPVWISDKAPSIPASTRRAVHARDQGCRFPGCGGRVFTQVHHVRHRARGGGNELTNLVELCWFHHRLVHEGGWSVRFDCRGEALAIRPNGNVLGRPRAIEVHDRHGLERRNRERGAAIDPTTCIPRWYGDQFDLGEIVSGLMTN